MLFPPVPLLLCVACHLHFCSLSLLVSFGIFVGFRSVCFRYVCFRFVCIHLLSLAAVPFAFVMLASVLFSSVGFSLLPSCLVGCILADR